MLICVVRNYAIAICSFLTWAANMAGIVCQVSIVRGMLTSRVIWYNYLIGNVAHVKSMKGVDKVSPAHAKNAGECYQPRACTSTGNG